MYASLPDVQALVAARPITATSVPNATQVAIFLELSAAELDAILIERQYQLPVPTTATAALALLRQANAKGARAMVEEASPNSPHLKSAQQAWDEAKKMLRAADQVLESPKSQGRSQPRGPGQTTPPAFPPAGRAVYNPHEIGCDLDNDPKLPLISRREKY